MRELVRVYKALSDESRLRVLGLLLERECCVCEVMQALEISPSKASRNLSALYGVGFLKSRKEGLWVLYSIDWDGMNANLRNILEATRVAVKGNKQMELDHQRLRNAERVGASCVGKACFNRLAGEVS
jgi:ArsR family transcriptional regulator, arsenate/arsenite/antimonite-responsive transcriptional repressor